MSRLTGADAYGLMEAYQAVYAPKITEEQIQEDFENWVYSLVDEGEDLSEYTWDEMYESYLVNEYNFIVGGLIEEGYDLSEYTEQELFDALISEKKALGGALKNIWNMFPKKAPKQLGIPKAPSSSVPYGNRTLTGTPPRTGLPAAGGTSTPASSRSSALTAPASSRSSALTAPASSRSSALTAPASSRSSALTAPVGSTSNPIRTNLNVPGGPGGNKNGKRAAGLGLGLLGLGALASMNRGGGGNETGTSKAKPLASTTVPGKGGSPRRKEQLVGQKGDLKATDPVVADARKLNKMGGVSLGSGGTGYLATKGDKLVTVQAKGIGADDGIIGKAARKLGLTKDKDKALEAQRQNTSRANREKYLQGQELTDKNVTGYQAKGAVRKGEKTGLNIKDSYEYDTFDTVLEYLIAEGYADTEESALVIMANMSEEWRESIVEGLVDAVASGAGTVVGTAQRAAREIPKYVQQKVNNVAGTYERARQRADANAPSGGMTTKPRSREFSHGNQGGKPAATMKNPGPNFGRG